LKTVADDEAESGRDGFLRLEDKNRLIRGAAGIAHHFCRIRIKIAGQFAVQLLKVHCGSEDFGFDPVECSWIRHASNDSSGVLS